MLAQLENQESQESLDRMERMEKMDQEEFRDLLEIRAKLEMLARWVSRVLKGQLECRVSPGPEEMPAEREEWDFLGPWDLKVKQEREEPKAVLDQEDSKE